MSLYEDANVCKHSSLCGDIKTQKPFVVIIKDAIYLCLYDHLCDHIRMYYNYVGMLRLYDYNTSS